MTDKQELMYDLFGLEGIPINHFIKRLNEISGLSYPIVGKLVKQYGRKYTAYGILFAKKRNKESNLSYVIAIIDKIRYFDSARKGD